MDPILTPILFLACTGLSCVLMVVAIAGLLLLVLSRNREFSNPFAAPPSARRAPPTGREGLPRERTPAGAAPRAPVSRPAAPPAKVNPNVPTLLSIPRGETPPSATPVPSRPAPAASRPAPVLPPLPPPSVPAPLVPAPPAPAPTPVAAPPPVAFPSAPPPRPRVSPSEAPPVAPSSALGAGRLPPLAPVAAPFAAEPLPPLFGAGHEEEVVTTVAPPPGLGGAPVVAPPGKPLSTMDLPPVGKSDLLGAPRTSGSTIIAFDDDDEDW